MNPDRLAALEEERRFLLRSIADLDREHAAGDVDARDYASLRDGYVDRAADVLRAIEEGRLALPERPRRAWLRLAVGVVVTLAVAAAAGWWVADSSGQRLPGQSITGGAPTDEVTAKLAAARALLATDASGAVKLYQQVREIDPANAEARTYTAWLLVLSSRSASAEVAAAALRQGVDELQAVTASEAGYADAWCLLAVARGNFQNPPDAAGAQTAAQACLERNPPADMRGLIESFIASQQSTATPGTATPGTAPTTP